MLFKALAEEEYVIDKLRPDLEKRLARRGFVALFWGDSGWAHFFSRNPAMRPGDFKGMKIFVTASGSAAQMQIMQALGYTPVPSMPPMPSSSCRPAASTSCRRCLSWRWPASIPPSPSTCST